MRWVNGKTGVGWRRVRLGDVLFPRPNIVHPRDKPSGTARFVGLEHIEPHTGRRIGELAVRMENLTGRKARFFAGDIVYGYLRPYLNKVWIADFDGLCSVDQYVFEIRRELAHTSFIASFMRSSIYLSRAPICETPGQLPRIRTEEVAAVEINLPPLDVQRRIAARMDAESSAATELRAALEAQLAAAEALPASNLRAVFESSESACWPRRAFGEVCELLPARSISTAGDVDVRAITSACLTETGFRLDGVKSARIHAEHVAECTVRKGEILIARSNTPELVGRVAMFLGEAPNLVATDLTIRMAPRAIIDGGFLMRHLSHLYLSGYWRERASGASGTMKKITRSQLLSEKVPAPPLETQRAIAARLDAEFSAAAALRAALAAKLAEVQKLPASLLRTAFAQGD